MNWGKFEYRDSSILDIRLSDSGANWQVTLEDGEKVYLDLNEGKITSGMMYVNISDLAFADRALKQFPEIGDIEPKGRPIKGLDHHGPNKGILNDGTIV